MDSRAQAQTIARMEARKGVQTFAADQDRKRLTPTALKAFVRLAAQWQLDNEEAAALLGASPSTWTELNPASGTALSTRIK